jgi:hypothetical protein
MSTGGPRLLAAAIAALAASLGSVDITRREYQSPQQDEGHKALRAKRKLHRQNIKKGRQ